MAYAVKEIFPTLQGEGANTGRSAVFCRFSGCNLWTGREQDRHKAICQFCDTDFVGTDGEGGGQFRDSSQLAGAIEECWMGETETNKLVVCTGGEPLLQLDGALVDALHERGFEIAVETNGTLPLPDGIDWVCVSPKEGTKLVIRHGNELKLVFPQPNALPERYVGMSFDHMFVQPMDGPQVEENTSAAIAYCMTHPEWRLSVQTHKSIGIR